MMGVGSFKKVAGTALGWPVASTIIEQLPYIDEHRQRVDASADAVWAVLSKVLHRELGGSPSCGSWAATPR